MSYIKKISEVAKAKWADPEYKKKYGQIVSETMRKGPYRITFDTGKEITIDSLGKWAEENNYTNQILFDMVNNRKRRRKKEAKKLYPINRYKDIIKVERLSDEEEK